MPSGDSAQTFFWNAVACASSADYALGKFGREGAGAADTQALQAPYTYVCVLLLAQGIELAVKAWFIHVGVPAEELRRRSFGHDLVALFERADAKDYPLCGAAEFGVLHTLNCAYRDDKELQHPKPRPIAAPSALAARELLHETLQVAATAIYPSVDLDRVRSAANPGRWRGLRVDALGLYRGESLALLRQAAEPAERVAPQRT